METRMLTDNVFVIEMQSHRNSKGEYENRFNLEIVEHLNKALDEALLSSARAVIISGGNGKFFSNGHDITWLEENFDSRRSHQFIDEFYALLARLLCFPLPTVAAINGHAFAGGCLLAMSMDYRVMQNNRGFLCMNEIDMVPEQASAIPSKIKPDVLSELIKCLSRYFRKRYHTICCETCSFKVFVLTAKTLNPKVWSTLWLLMRWTVLTLWRKPWARKHIMPIAGHSPYSNSSCIEILLTS